MTNKEAADALRDFKNFDSSIVMTKTAKEVFDKAVEALEKEDEDDWIHRPVSDPRWNRKFKEIEEALGFKLFIWQKSYIMEGKYRQYGRTTAEILEELLDANATPLDYTKNRSRSVKEDFYRCELREIKSKLNEAGIPTRPVFFSIDDKLAWEYEETKKKAEEEEKKTYKAPFTDMISPEKIQAAVGLDPTNTDPVCNNFGDLIKRCSTSYDDFLLECFKPFGVTKDNILSWIDRIHKEEYHDIEANIIYHRYFIDSVYAFTVSVTCSISDDHVFTQEYRKFIEEDLKEGGKPNGDDK